MVNISAFDLWDTYLPQYAAGFGAGSNASGGSVPAAMGAMCSCTASQRPPRPPNKTTASNNKTHRRAQLGSLACYTGFL